MSAWWRLQAPEVDGNRAMTVSALTLVGVTLLLLPLQDIRVPAATGFQAAMIVAVGILTSLTIYLLIGDYADRGDVRLLSTASAYAGGLVFLIACLVSSSAPGDASWSAATASSERGLWVGGCLTLAVGLALAWAPWPSSWVETTPQHRRSSIAVAAIGVSVAVAVSLIVAVVVVAHRLQGRDVEVLDRGLAAAVVLTLSAAMVVVMRGTLRRSGPERWVSLTAFACLGSVAVSLNAPQGTSVGWYAGGALLLVGAAVLVLAWIAEARQISAKAAHDAAFDALTGLPNRRNGHQLLDQTVARCRRAGSPLAMLLVDLDDFHEINESYGFEAGDAALAAVGRLLTAACRTGDVVARIGGEEFMILLPDTKDRGTLIVADKIRSAVALEPIDPIGVPLTVSIGATTLQIHDLDPNEMLRRASTALSRAQETGRNRIILLAGMTDDDLLGAL
jgi:diguanylate cyclase (GGDEF)-like protein